MNDYTISSDQLAELIVAGIKEKKGEKIVKLDLRNLDSSVCDSFIIAQADNPRQVLAIADGIEDYVFEHIKQWPYHREGRENAEWVLLDYIDVVVHVFLEEKRSFYKLEKLWADAKRTDYPDED
ncbi:MAG: ribosome silencing factor [Bacteroidales bacterium]|jgi:ribosome-associated protein|nr:ribosome silencing factor [Bacteroidales bacterium]